MFSICLKGIAIVDGEQVTFATEPEVIFRDPPSSSLTVHYSLKVDSGLSFAVALAARDDALKSSAIKSNLQARRA